MPTVQTFEKFSDAVKWLSAYVQTDLPQLMAEIEGARGGDSSSVGGFLLASCEEAAAGEDNTKAMTPLRTREALEALLSPLGALGSVSKNPSIPTFDLDDLKESGEYFIEPAYYGNLLHLPFASFDFYLTVSSTEARNMVCQKAWYEGAEKIRFYKEGGFGEWALAPLRLADAEEAKEGQSQELAVSPSSLSGVLDARIYKGSSQSNVNFPIGTLLLVSGSTARNASVSVYLDSANGYAFTGSAKLMGNWAARGNIGSVTLVQRIQ